MTSAKHKLSMYGSVAAIVSVVTFALYLLLNYFTSLPMLAVFVIIIPLFLLQWRFAPKIIEKAYKVEPASEEKHSELHKVVEVISERSGIEKPQLMIAKTELPNAFAYGNRWSGKKIAVTQGLLENLEFEEVEAVVGHELGHHKHGDAKIMMFLSILPAIFMMIGRIFLFSMFFGGGNRRGVAPMMALGAGSMLVYFALNLCIMNFSRMREFMADDHAAENVPDGARKLSEGLAKINHYTSEIKNGGKKQSEKVKITRPADNKEVHVRGSSREQNNKGMSSFGMSLKPLFIEDPDTSKDLSTDQLSDQELVEKYSKEELSTGEKIMELFSSHPRVAKRLRVLQEKQ
ncbi:hypothetical protein AKJ39_02480 [candidate division MSBL1 archaeon SCGC-AAA259J03]|uniref:Peptidase M48 domain-containing protein n=1 Tax=candidate division MSBL1 archaeon SCGC-AAA259J03 TaxID=1698269 RepID=A0A656YY92_9EURY|nr:hypothetical protein AKJ39_02480 [candidate division MSBL1 archaeon SCGC-AAA259J03]